jgi:intron-binding protein aquarius
MTCTHAAIARARLVELGFHYDNVIVEEAGQMLDIETFVPLLIQGGESDDSSSSSNSRLKRVCLIGDHNQLPPVVKNISFSKFSHYDQSLFARLIKLGVPSIELNKQGRARADIARLYSWRYDDLGDLEHVLKKEEFKKANTGLAHTFQLINVDDFEGRGESTPTAYFYQNVGEAEYSVALFQYLVLIGYPPEKISILTTYNGQKELITDILSQRCGAGTPLAGIKPGAISTVDQYQGQQNNFIILSLVRTKNVGHLRDIRRLVVAVSRARLGLYVLCRKDLFCHCHELRRSMDQLAAKPTKLQLVKGEHFPTERMANDKVDAHKVHEINDVTELGELVHSMQQDYLSNQQ